MHPGAALVFACLLGLPAAGANAGEPVAAPDLPETPATWTKRPQWPTHEQHTAASTDSSLPGRAGEPPQPAVFDAGENYVLQVGAFRELARAQSAARAMGLAELRIIATLRNEQDWYVLVLGAYAEREEALAAGQAYLGAYPGGATWVRAASDLERVLVSR